MTLHGGEFVELYFFFFFEFGNFFLAFDKNLVWFGVRVIEVDHLKILVFLLQRLGGFLRGKESIEVKKMILGLGMEVRKVSRGGSG